MAVGGPFGSLLVLATALLPAPVAARGSREIDVRAAATHVWQHGITDHPLHAAAEDAAGDLGRSSATPLIGQPREGGPSLQASSMAEPRARGGGGQRLRWRLTDEGIPCQLPFTFEGTTYEDCHPAGWCCLDPVCARRGSCSKPKRGGNSTLSAMEPLPLVHPRDEPETACSLPTVGETPFTWRPGDSAGGNATTVFLMLPADADAPWEEDLSPLMELAQEPVNLVWLSYSAGAADVEGVMRRMQSRMKEVIRNASTPADRAPRAAAGGREVAPMDSRIFFVKTPAWHVSMRSCWLPSLVHAWSRTSPTLVATVSGAGSSKSALFRTAAGGVKGSWAPSYEAGTAKTVVGTLRWFGLACGEPEDKATERGLAPVTRLNGSVALVQRGRCSFYSKVRRAEEAGASAVIIFSNDDSPFAMGCANPDPCQDSPLKIPAFMIGHSHGSELLGALNASTGDVTVQLEGGRRGPSHAAVVGGNGGVRAFGSAQQGLLSVAREALGLERERRLAARRAELEARAAAGDGAALVTVFERQHLAGSLSAPWSAERVAALRDQHYDSLELELRLDCDDHLDENCGPWDFEIDLYLCGADNSACRDRSANVARWITPYSREARWVSNATAALPLLLRGRADGKGLPGFLHIQSNWWQAYTVTLALWFRRSEPASARGPALLHMPMWSGGPFNQGYNSAQRPRDFLVPAGASKAVLSVLLSGHGWGLEEANCAEFCNHSHHFSVNGREEVVQAFPEAGTTDACGAKVREGVIANQYGTWTFGRAGWCPGMPVSWWEVDVTSFLLSSNRSNSISYRALFNGTDYTPVPATDPNTNGYDAVIHLASFLTFYGSAPGHARGDPAREPRAQAERRRPILLL